MKIDRFSLKNTLSKNKNNNAHLYYKSYYLTNIA